ncbi:MAG TPA: hypothetical protein VFV78_14420 [Vicinamibacterales bacterium]|nr:hypothetical protein [Vicinamibacterales bacterium]
MKTAFTALAVCVAVGVSTAAFQQQPPPPPPGQQQQQTPPPAQAQPPADQTQKTPPDVTLTGCLIQGSSPSVFLFDEAKKDAQSKTEKGVRYLVLIAGEDLDLRSQLNHKVTMTGRVELKPALPPGQKPTEKDLPTFATKNVTLVSDTCAPAK